ncbi:MocR-like pyridoxine biosynthesis transcription factor PdxR [Streptomyces sp. WMMC897]|uniref:MocR-like pyridoxine biosynthesis transcription factor PdxR n=1 Tax=Streptomyces sp. WMMC897 TaxID=3014782 RepID=UPI0022B6ADFC|nr:PLP-dependent aminotransferase family protein [Streptomyces sp. WMMC897]MCZ7416036.1 PLP-dependent aminotransferase family protein [Streptomyces sp. WMMC897]
MSAIPRAHTLDLHLELDLRRRRGRREQLAAALRRAVESGRLPPGARLPSTRSVAAEFGIARGTVVAAYQLLLAEGYLETVQGSGTRVVGTAPPAPRAAARSALTPSPVARGARRYSFQPGMPDVTLFPRNAWIKSTQHVLTTVPAEALDYGDPRGRIELRQALADYLARSRGVITQPERIIICHGFTQALGLITTVLAEHGVDTVSVENPCYPLFRDVIQLAGLDVHTVDVDGDGLLPAGLAGGAAVVTPIHQYPLGVNLATERRRALVGWAKDVDAVIVEDDYDSEFQYGKQRVGTLQPMAPDRVIYAGTTSKTLAPGIRLSWLAVPPDWVERITSAKRIADRHTAALTQMVMADLLLSGAYDRHIRQCRDHYRRRRDQLSGALAEHAPTAWLAGESAGLHALVRWSPEGPAERDVVRAARSESLTVVGLGGYWGTPGPHAPGLVLGYATPPRHAFAGALDALSRVLARCFG